MEQNNNEQIIKNIIKLLKGMTHAEAEKLLFEAMRKLSSTIVVS